MPELFIVHVVIKRQYWNTIINIHSKTERAIVYYNHIFQIPVGNYTQIFDQAKLGLNAMLSIKSKCKYLSLRIKKIKNGIGI